MYQNFTLTEPIPLNMFCQLTVQTSFMLKYVIKMVSVQPSEMLVFSRAKIIQARSLSYLSFYIYNSFCINLSICLNFILVSYFQLQKACQDYRSNDKYI